jgi:hypothetical protein
LLINSFGLLQEEAGMVKRLPGARLLTVAALFAGCINNPTDEPAASLEGEWINAWSFGGGKSNSITWGRFQVAGDSFHITFNYEYCTCDPDYGIIGIDVRCGDDSAKGEPCTAACGHCDTLRMQLTVCHVIVDTIGYAYASGRISSENDSTFNFNGVMSDTFYVRCATGVSDTMTTYAEKAVISWYGDDTLMLRTDGNSYTDEGIWLLVRSR